MRTYRVVKTILERYLWACQDTLMLGCRPIGYGSVGGELSLVKGCIPLNVIAAGIPAGTLPQTRSWGRSPFGMIQAMMAVPRHLDKQTFCEP